MERDDSNAIPEGIIPGTSSSHSPKGYPLHGEVSVFSIRGSVIEERDGDCMVARRKPQLPRIELARP